MLKAKQAVLKLWTAKKVLHGAGKAVIAFAAGAALVISNIGRALHEMASDVGSHVKQKNEEKSEEVITMKKSTLIGLLVALAAIAGVLGALYVYVLRREKELDEYEQLLFSEDFGDVFADDLDEMPEEEEIIEEEA